MSNPCESNGAELAVVRWQFSAEACSRAVLKKILRRKPVPPLKENPVFGWDGVGASVDGLRATDHDWVLYGA
jgi:hypothetical protein